MLGKADVEQLAVECKMGIGTKNALLEAWEAGKD